MSIYLNAGEKKGWERNIIGNKQIGDREQEILEGGLGSVWQRKQFQRVLEQKLHKVN